MNNFKYIDNHSHLNLNAFKDDYKEVIGRATDAGVQIINVGTQRDTSKRAVEIAEECGCYAIVGLHPVHTSKSFHDIQELGEGGQEFTSRGEAFDFEYYKTLALNPKVVGIGECGLDYFRTEENTKEIQMHAFEEQIKLAIEVDKPLMLHIRDNGKVEAYQDAIDIIKKYKAEHPNLRGDVHFFAGNIDIVDQFLELGFTFSFTGAITYGHNYDEVIKHIPLDRILSETDCPFVAPIPYRGKRNEPAYVAEVVKKIAEIKGLSVDEVAPQLLENSKKLFRI
ncbi:MAG: TatD family hydrolase [Patescibacteria group bacterium]